jgi:F0F1-type ATP synthase delta subunit
MISRLSRSLIKPVNSKYFSSQIKSVQGNRPPLNEENIPGRYAGVLFTISSQKESLNLVNADMEYLSQLINGSESFKSFLSNTAAKKSEHIAVLSEIYPGLNEITVKFLGNISF